MNPLAYLQFFVPKRHASLHWLYRRMHRAYAWFLVAIDPKLTMQEFFALLIGGPILLFILIFSLITMMMP